MTMNSCGPFEMLCPGCGTAFSVDAVKVASIVEQVKEQIGDRIRNEVKADQETCVCYNTMCEVSLMPYFNHEAYEALLNKMRAVEKDDLEIIRDATEDCLRYVQTVCDGENRLNTADEPDRSMIKDYDTKRHNAHENAISSVTLLNRLADQYGIALPFTGDIADRHQVADFCLELTVWLFRDRRKVL